MKVGDQVGWQWGRGIAIGLVTQIEPERTQIECNGKIIRRNGTRDDPAIIILSEKGSQVLKLQHEVQIIKEEKHV